MMDGIRRLRELGVWDHFEGEDVFAADIEP
jgi:hypothetical protein